MNPAAALAPAHLLAASPAALLLPFVAMLLAVSLLPLVAPHWWEQDRHRAAVSALLGGPVALWLSHWQPQQLRHTVAEYTAFMVVLVALYVITSHIVIDGAPAATARGNTLVLGAGALLASLIGTTGTTMLLLRPLLRSNATRQKQAHVLVFFIFVAGNFGGLLTPMGDPPLFLGLLRGVPFFWTLRLWPAWLLTNVALLGIFYLVDRHQFRRQPAAAAVAATPLRLRGATNLGLLLGVAATVALSGLLEVPEWLSQAVLLSLAALAWKTSPPAWRQANRFGWGPIREVGIVFAGIFLTMAPALLLLQSSRDRLLTVIDPHHPATFFWVTGLLSSVLDNAPTYLTACATACSLLELPAQQLGALARHPVGEPLLRAISCGAVMMGALTYLGNGPNLLVKAVAEQNGVRMPSFFGYLGVAALTLLPLLAGVSWIFF